MSNWKAYQYVRSKEGQIRLGLEHYYKPYVNSDVTTAGYCTIKSYKNDFENIESYTFPEGSNAITFTENKNYERHCGKYYCADAKNFRGTIYQDVKVSHSGAYVIECKGFSTTTKAKLYACLVKSDNTADTQTMHATILGQTDYMSAQEKKALHIEEQNMDYAAKEFYGSHKYFNSVLVQVPEGGGTERSGSVSKSERRMTRSLWNQRKSGRYSMTSASSIQARQQMATWSSTRTGTTWIIWRIAPTPTRA